MKLKIYLLKEKVSTFSPIPCCKLLEKVYSYKTFHQQIQIDKSNHVG